MHTLCEHQDRVNCVRWIQDGQQSQEKEFVSGSVDKTVIVWASSKTSSGINCSKVATLLGKDNEF